MKEVNGVIESIESFIIMHPKLSSALVLVLIAVIEAIFGIRLGEPIADTVEAVG